MKRKIYLINAKYEIDLQTENSENIKKYVSKDFHEFTTGTHEDYRSADKLLYLDNIRKRLHIENFDEYVADHIKGKIEYEIEYGLLDDNKFEIEFDYEFAKNVFNDDRSFYKSGQKLKIYNNLIAIIETVIQYDRKNYREEIKENEEIDNRN